MSQESLILLSNLLTEFKFGDSIYYKFTFISNLMQIDSYKCMRIIFRVIYFSSSLFYSFPKRQSIFAKLILDCRLKYELCYLFNEFLFFINIRLPKTPIQNIYIDYKCQFKIFIYFYLKIQNAVQDRKFALPVSWNSDWISSSSMG